MAFIGKFGVSAAGAGLVGAYQMVIMRWTGAAFCLGLLVSGCSVSLDDTASIYAAPGQFNFLKCPDLASRTRTLNQRETELTGLMQRAGRDAGGAIVNTLVYQDELNTVRAQRQEMRKVADEKHCPPPGPEPAVTSLQPVH